MGNVCKKERTGPEATERKNEEEEEEPAEEQNGSKRTRVSEAE